MNINHPFGTSGMMRLRRGLLGASRGRSKQGLQSHAAKTGGARLEKESSCLVFDAIATQRFAKVHGSVFGENFVEIENGIGHERQVAARAFVKL
jgi:hypothetical protein